MRDYLAKNLVQGAFSGELRLGETFWWNSIQTFINSILSSQLASVGLAWCWLCAPSWQKNYCKKTTNKCMTFRGVIFTSSIDVQYKEAKRLRCYQICFLLCPHIVLSKSAPNWSTACHARSPKVCIESIKQLESSGPTTFQDNSEKR